MKNDENLSLQPLIEKIIGITSQCNITMREDSSGLRGLYSTKKYHIGDKIL